VQYFEHVAYLHATYWVVKMSFRHQILSLSNIFVDQFAKFLQALNCETNLLA